MSDLDWAKAQLAELRLSNTSSGEDLLVYQTVMQLLSVLYQQNHTKTSKERTVSLFSELAQNHALREEDPEVWVPLQSGLFRKGDSVRVRLDAFSDERGSVHNGRVGVIVDTRRGDVIVDIRDNLDPTITGYHYRPEQLEGRAS